MKDKTTAAATAQCECEAKAVTFISSFAYCEKCRRRIDSEDLKPLFEPMAEAAPVKRRASYGIY